MKVKMKMRKMIKSKDVINCDNISVQCYSDINLNIRLE